MKVNINQQSFVAFLENVTETIVSSVNVENYLFTTHTIVISDNSLSKRYFPSFQYKKVILDKFNSIKFNQNGSNPKFEEQIDDVLSSMTMNKDFRTAVPDLLEVYTRLGMTTQHSSPAKVFEQVRVQSAAMGKLLKSVGVQPE